MGRPLGATASDQAHHELTNQEVENRASVTRASSTSLSNASARAVGTAIHRVLEDFDFAADPQNELTRQREALSQDLSRNAPEREQKAAQAAALRLFDQIASGELLARLRLLSDRFVAQELPVLLPPGEDEKPNADPSPRAIDYLVGSIDLVYRDPDSDELVVADYKTDSLADGESLPDRIRSYAKQGAIYQRAIRESLALPYTPRFELWFLDLDQIVEVPSTSTA
jgi:ATP-dependent exoDNAse (exonuclease V) beta subunit